SGRLGAECENQGEREESCCPGSGPKAHGCLPLSKNLGEITGWCDCRWVLLPVQLASPLPKKIIRRQSTPSPISLAHGDPYDDRLVVPAGQMCSILYSGGWAASAPRNSCTCESSMQRDGKHARILFRCRYAEAMGVAIVVG